MKTSFPTEQRWEQQEKHIGGWRSVTVVVVSMAIFLDALDVSIVNVALPAIKLDLHLTTADLPWVQGAYLLTYAGLMLLGGRAADLLGRRRIFLLGSTLFGLGSLSGGLATSVWLLIVARGVQGIGAALTAPSAVSILTTTFAEGPERNKALGVFSATGGLGFTFGLVLGGVLTNFISWHWVFFVNVPVVLLILLLAPIVVPESRSSSFHPETVRNGLQIRKATSVPVRRCVLSWLIRLRSRSWLGASPFWLPFSQAQAREEVIALASIQKQSALS